MSSDIPLRPGEELYRVTGADGTIVGSLIFDEDSYCTKATRALQEFKEINYDWYALQCTERGWTSVKA